MQRIDDGKKTFIALVDADGCFYNTIVDASIRYLIAEYSTVIDEIVDDPSIVKSRSHLIDLMQKSILENIGIFSAQYASTGKVHMRRDINKIMLDKCEDDATQSDVSLKISKIKLNYILKMGAVDELRELYQIILLLANESLFRYIESRVKTDGYHQLLLMSGSNRQSRNRELVNMISNGTALFANDLTGMAALLRVSVNHHNPMPITCYFDRFLLADVYADKCDGYSFDLIVQEIMSEEDETFNHHDYVFDETKFTLIYAMLHYAAAKHAGHAMTMAFFDDRRDIHETILKIFSAHPDLIPENVTFECWHYQGIMLDQPVTVIKGKGVVDYHFRENVKKIIEVCGFSATEYQKAVDTGAVILKDEAMPLLAAFKELRSLLHPEQHELSSLFQNALTLFSSPEPGSTSSAAAAAAAAAATSNPSGYHGP